MLIMIITNINMVTNVEPRENNATVDKPSIQIQLQQRFCLYRAHMCPEGVLNWKKTPIFFVDAKRSEIGQEFQKHKS